MERFLILGFAPGNAETILEMMDGFFYIHPYFVGGIPFLCAADGSGIST